MRKMICYILVAVLILGTFVGCKKQNTLPTESAGTNQTVTQQGTETHTTEFVPPSVNVAISDEFVAACNLNFGGYINFLNGKYYYRGENDSLFMCDADGKNAVCIDSCADEDISRIAVDETAVYYLKSRTLDTPLQIGDYMRPFERQLRRFSDGKVTVLSQDDVISYALSKDYIFYAAADLKVYRMRHDGTEKTAILELQRPMNIAVSGNRVYAYMEETIIATDFYGKDPRTSRVYIYAAAFNGPTMYYINLNGCGLCKTDLNGVEIQTVVDGPIQSFTVYNGRLVYRKMFTDEIVIADMDGKNPRVVCTGESPIALNGHLFYLDNGNIKLADIK